MVASWRVFDCTLGDTIETRRGRRDAASVIRGSVRGIRPGARAEVFAGGDVTQVGRG